MKSLAPSLGLLAAGLLFSLLAIFYFPAAFLCIFSAWTLVGIVVGCYSKGTASKLGLMLAASALALTLAEGYFMFTNPQVDRSIDDGGQPFKERHAILGHPLAPHGKRTHRVSIKGEPIYDVEFQTDASGLRLNPHQPTEATEKAVLFFGGSFMYGISAEDHQTLPALVARDADPPLATYNFAVDGWGSHQVVALLENQLEAKALSGDHSSYVGVYQAIIHHVDRAAGKTLWGFYGPQYALNEAGILTYTGSFYSYPASRLMRGLSRSHLFRRLHAASSSRTEQDIDLYLATVERARHLFEERYKGPFIVLLWNLGEPEYPEILRGLKERGITVYEVSHILSGFDEFPEAYLYPFDRHPTPETYKKLAAFLLQTL